MARKTSFTFAIFSLAFLGIGCQFLGHSFEDAASLDQSGKTVEAIEAYQSYLNHHSGSILTAKAEYRIARNYEAQSDYTDAIQWYEKITQDAPRSDEELHALLDLADLYQDKLKNQSKGMEYNLKAFNRYMDNPQIRDAIQALIDTQYNTATALFAQKNYKGAVEAVDNVYKTFPTLLIQADTRAKVDSLAERSQRALDIAKAGVDWVVLKSEMPFNKSYEEDFPPGVEENKVMPSPNGLYLAERKRAPNDKYYLYVAKVSPKSDQAVFELLPQTVGAEMPAWSPDGKELVYWQTLHRRRKLQKTDVQTRLTQTLFYTNTENLGIHPAYHPAGNKIAYVYAGKVCLAGTEGPGYKQLLKTNQKLDYTAELTWSNDGTMIRCRQVAKSGKVKDELLLLDVSPPNNL